MGDAKYAIGQEVHTPQTTGSEPGRGTVTEVNRVGTGWGYMVEASSGKIGHYPEELLSEAGPAPEAGSESVEAPTSDDPTDGHLEEPA